MGEANPEGLSLIEQVTGHTPRYAETDAGEQRLHVGDTVLIAAGLALWSDPDVWQHDDSSLTVRWGGQVARFTKDADGSWNATVQAGPIRGKARWVP